MTVLDFRSGGYADSPDGYAAGDRSSAPAPHWESQGWQAPNAHNGYRETMLGLGSVGLLLLIALTFRAVAQGVTLCSMAPGEGWILPVLIVCISLILNLSESIFLKQNDLLWLLYSASVISISCRHAALRHPVPEPACIVATAI